MMKSEPRAFASLSSGLLARKGAARPAMRPQGFGQMGSGLEDLGWNDMGFEPPRVALAPVDESDVPTPARVNPAAGLTPASPVHAVQDKLAQRFETEDSDDSESASAVSEASEHAVEEAPAAEVVNLPARPVQPSRSVRAPRARHVPGSKAKAAFTLRLDSERHLKLRLACAVTGTSAQQLVTRALDELLGTIPELDAMADRAPERSVRKG